MIHNIYIFQETSGLWPIFGFWGVYRNAERSKKIRVQN